MSSPKDSLQSFIHDIRAVEFGDECPEIIFRLTTELLRGILSCREPASNYHYSFSGIRSAVYDLARDCPASSHALLTEGLAFAAETLLDSLASEQLIEHDSNMFLHQLAEPEAGVTIEEKRSVSRERCLEILASGFFGITQRSGWGKRKQADKKDMPPFTFEKLWEYDCDRWKTKNLVLMGVLLYFWQASKLGRGTLQAECLTITRKAIGDVSTPDSTTLFCDVDLEQDGTSIHSFSGAEHLQADFANEYLGGGVMSGGGSQEEAMFVEHTELLVTIFLVEKLLPFEAVEVEGARRYIEHNIMGARNCSRAQQFCRPVELTQDTITAVALDAICFNAYGIPKDQQYRPANIWRELRKCLAALTLPEGVEPSTRTFVTGLWGCGAFRGDPELKCIIQWICCSLEPSVSSMTFCPFDQRERLLDSGLAELLELLPRKVPVKKVLDMLVNDSDYAQSPNTFRYLLHKLRAEDTAEI